MHHPPTRSRETQSTSTILILPFRPILQHKDKSPAQSNNYPTGSSTMHAFEPDLEQPPNKWAQIEGEQAATEPTWQRRRRRTSDGLPNQQARTGGGPRRRLGRRRTEESPVASSARTSFPKRRVPSSLRTRTEGFKQCYPEHPRPN
jgi:hypothetical protein